MLNMNLLPAYELLKQEELKALNSQGYLLRHKKTGARVCLVSNSDENKVFTIGFRTPPTDDTGVPHILEHSVLCGSEKFPLKDPFVELIKGSLNTFINAMTFPDKTIYPVASCNDKDFQNLMDVYLDAVLRPNIYKRPEIFMQEGWHYEILNEEEPITINGVVYNEMKGAFSSADTYMAWEIEKALFPDTIYKNQSGGFPEAIPNLTYEQFVNFHKTYYHPSNSYIYLYGDMDMVEKLNWIDENYLKNYDYLEINSEIETQKPFEAPVEVKGRFNISNNESEDKKSMFSYSAAISDSLDRELHIAMDVIDYALFSAPGAPLKQALLDAGIGNDISSGWETSVKQPIFNVIAKNTNPEQFEDFKKILVDTLKEQVKNGINKDAIEACLNIQEFKYREADFGNFPKGLFYGMNLLSSWLYDENQPFVLVELLDVFAKLRANINTGYFEELVEKHLINNNHAAYIMLQPEKGKSEREAEALAKKLEEFKASLSKEELQKLIDDTKHLKEYQDAPSTKEELECIPMLKREDLDPEPMEIRNRIEKIVGIPTYYHNYFTNGIHYLQLLFDVKKLPVDMIPYLGILEKVWGLVDTDNYSYGELSNEIFKKTGGVSASVQFYENIKKYDTFDVKFQIGIRTFNNKMEDAMKLVGEIIARSHYDQDKRLRELIGETRSRMLDEIAGRGNMYGAMRAESYHSRMAGIKDKVNGLDFYETIARIDDNFEEEKARLISNLQTLCTVIFRKENLIVNSTCDEEEFKALEPIIKDFSFELSDKDYSYSVTEVVPEQKNEGVAVASQVQYVCRSGDYTLDYHEYCGPMQVVQMILSYEYLWLNVRVKGGAYGCGGRLAKNGYMTLSSYRDPNCKATNEVFHGIPEFLRNFNVDEREMTKYIIGTMGNMDSPLTPNAKGLRSLGLALRNITIEDLAKERKEVINTSQADIQALAKVFEDLLAQGHICVIGGEKKLEEDKDIFMTIKNLK